MADEQAPREHPMVDGAPINPYDLPGTPRPEHDPDKYGTAVGGAGADDVSDPDAAPTADESAPVPGPGDPDATTLVEVGGAGVGELGMQGGTNADTLKLEDVVSAEQAEALRAAGFDSAEKIRSASNDELDAVPGIGPGTIEKLRDATRA